MHMWNAAERHEECFRGWPELGRIRLLLRGFNGLQKPQILSGLCLNHPWGRLATYST